MDIYLDPATEIKACFRIAYVLGFWSWKGEQIMSDRKRGKRRNPYIRKKNNWPDVLTGKGMQIV